MHARWQEPALSGEGATLYPGRWNSAGDRMVYLADSLALAVLETRVHLESFNSDEPYVAIEFTLPDSAVSLVGGLPQGWQSDFAHTRSLGSKWLRGGESLVLRVPSAMIPDGHNLLVNPFHEAAGRIAERRRLDFRWDDRLF